MGIQHRNALSVNLLHGFDDHGRFACSFLANQKKVSTYFLTANNAIDFFLLVTLYPMHIANLRNLPLRSQIEVRITRFEGVLYLLKD